MSAFKEQHRDGMSFEELDKLSLLDAVVKEALRVAGSAPFLFERIATKDFTLGEIKIRKGDLLNVPISYFNTRSDIYESGSRFDVNNFAKHVPTAKHAQYHPFSIGRRSCPGKYFAEMTMKIFIMSLVSHAEVVPASEKPGEWILRTGYELKEVVLDCKKL